MRNFFAYGALLLSLSLVMACSSSKDMNKAEEVIIEETQLDTVFVTAAAETEAEEISYELPVYQAAARRTADLIHTSLDLKFDWSKQLVIGKAELELEPIFYELSEISLDAHNFIINSIKNERGQDLKYSYDDADIVIQLPQPAKKGQKIRVMIDYVAQPEMGGKGGSAAITSDKGLFFIDPLNEDPEKPSQIWTQGETEHNSRWFPTIDKPNERGTQQIKLTVQDKYRTLSNGLLVDSRKNADGTRTDIWRQNKPHAPYLAMIAVGEFATVDDRWKNIPLEYIVEEEYKESAKDIFDHTPKMLSFFSEYTGVDYPWDKYSQIIVRDYVSGAMENTSAVIFGDFVQKHKRELIDNHNDRIVAHEMFHHWFGDYVTCESWSNLTLNEGFANYSEYLWAEHHEGVDAADHHRYSEMEGYVQSAMQQGVHPLIHYSYDVAEQMFDAHSYNKGGLVLHMLRYYVGDDAFQASLNKYLTDNAFTAVEADELRMAFEDVTGMDLNWFFDQWYLGTGHPLLAVNKSYNVETGELTVEISQEQDADMMEPIFELPLEIDIYQASGQKIRKKIRMTQRSQSWTFDVDYEPALVDIDPSKTTLALWNYEKTPEEYAFQYAHTEKYNARRQALEMLTNSGYEGADDIYMSALDDPFHLMRATAVSNLSLEDHPELMDRFKKLALKDPHSSVRSVALDKIASQEGADVLPTLEKAMNDQAYPVVGTALNGIYSLDSEKGLMLAKKMEKGASESILPSIARIYADQGSAEFSPFFREQLSGLSGYNIFNFMGGYVKHIQGLDELEALKETKHIVTQAEKTDDIYGKLGLMYGLFQLQGFADETNEMGMYLNKEVTRLVEEESNPMLKGYYKQMGG